MVAQIKLCKRSFKITCSGFSTLKVDPQSICHLTPGPSGISVGTEGSANPKSSLYRKTLKEKHTNIKSHGHTPWPGPGSCTDLSNKASCQALLEVSILHFWQERPSLKSLRSSFQSKIFQIQNFQNGDEFTG